MEGGDDGWGNIDWGEAAAREDVDFAECVLRLQNRRQQHFQRRQRYEQERQRHEQAAFRRLLDSGGAGPRLPDLPSSEQDLEVMRTFYVDASAILVNHRAINVSPPAYNAVMVNPPALNVGVVNPPAFNAGVVNPPAFNVNPVTSMGGLTVPQVLEPLMGRQIAADVPETLPTWFGLRSCDRGDGNGGNGNPGYRAGGASGSGSSSSFNLTRCSQPMVSDLMDTEFETEQPESGSSSRTFSDAGPSRPPDKLPKRTKLVAFTSRRRSREAEAFEVHSKELRMEMSTGPAFRESRAMVRTDAGTDGVLGETMRMDLTDDLLHKVFSCLDDTSLCSAAMVNRQWRVASSHEDFWKILNFEGRTVTAKQVRDLCQRYPKAFQLNLRCAVPIDENVLMDALRSLKTLQVLILGKGVYGDKFFTILCEECKFLRDVSVTDALLGSGATQDIQIRHDTLQKLHIIKCRVLRVAIRCAQLVDLSLKRTGTASTLLVCPMLERLDVSSCHKLSDAGLRAAATSCPLLMHLDISMCSYVSDETLREIAAACPMLRSLDATFCPNISLEGVRMPMLVSMTLSNCEGITTSSMTALAQCVFLEELFLDYCVLLTLVSLELPHLRSISLSHCRKFLELILRTPSLVSINVKNCPSLNRMDISSKSLQKLALSQQQGLSIVGLQCPQLQEVDLTDCDSLTNALCDVFSDGGGCPRLHSLILDNCEGLTAIKLSTLNLRTLSLVGCRKVASLKLDCPNLERLLLDGCDHLAAASLTAVGLRILNLGICPHLTTLTICAEQMTSLDLRGCGILNHAAVYCPSLVYLDASYCSQLEDDCLAATTEACPLIQSLVLASCPLIGATGLMALRKLKNLTTLDLSYTFLTDLSPIYEACPQLQVLKLSACKYLGDNALVPLYGGMFLSNLEELDLSYGSLGRSAIEALLAECPHLKRVSLNGCANVYDLVWPRQHTEDEDSTMEEASLEVEQCQAMDSTVAEHTSSAMEGVDGIYVVEKGLQTLNCVGCANITRVSIFPNAGCVHLTSLNMSLSNHIKVVRLACVNLATLNLSHCVALSELRLNCPRLSSLCLQASGIAEDELEHAVKGCVALETLDVRNCQKISSVALARIRLACSGIKRLYTSLA